MGKSKVQIIDSLIQEVTKFKMVDDNGLNLAREWLSLKIDGYRATIIKKAVSEKRDISSAYQKIDCLKPKCLGISCNVEGVLIEGKSDLWVVDVPQLLNVKNSIKYFGTFDFKKPLIGVDLSGLSDSFSRWDIEDRKYSLIGLKVYYTDFNGAKMPTMVALFANPSTVCGFNDEDPYPIMPEYEQSMELLIKKDLYQMLNIPLDEIDDTRDNPGMVKGNKSNG